MLHISDIEKKLKNNPIPYEILEVRKNIEEAFKNLEFVEEGHKYFLHKNGAVKEMNSVSSICHRFEPYVDWDEIKEKYAVKNNLTVEEVTRKWKETNIISTSNGTLTHLFAESYMYFFMGRPDLIPEPIKKMQYEDGFLIPYGRKQEAVVKYYEDLFNIDNFYPVMPEAKIYIDSDDNQYGIKTDISGTFDALFAYKTKNNEIRLSCRDWKTNKSLENDFNFNNNITLLPPFDTKEYINEPKSIYTIQLSLYQLGIEQLGYKVSDRKLLWLTDDGNYHKIDVNDVREKIINALSVD